MEKLESLVIDTDKFQIDVNGKSLLTEAIEIDVHITRHTVEVTAYKSKADVNDVGIKKWYQSMRWLKARKSSPNKMKELDAAARAIDKKLGTSDL